MTAPPAPIEFPAPPRRILVIKPSAIGDVVHALPALNLLRRRWPAARLSWLITPACAGILEGHPQVDELIPFERSQLARFWRSPGTLADAFGLAGDLRRRRFDLVVDLQGLFRSGWLTACDARAGADRLRRRAGGGGAGLHPHRPRAAAGAARGGPLPDGGRGLGCGREPVRFVFATDEADRAYVRARTPMAPARYAVLLPGTNWATKRWPAERFAALVRPLRERFGLESVVAGGPGDAEWAGGSPNWPAARASLDLTGRTNLRQLVALLEGAALVVANDSGPMHIAAALGRPLVALSARPTPPSPAPTGGPTACCAWTCRAAPATPAPARTRVA